MDKLEGEKPTTVFWLIDIEKLSPLLLPFAHMQSENNNTIMKVKLLIIINYVTNIELQVYFCLGIDQVAFKALQYLCLCQAAIVIN